MAFIGKGHRGAMTRLKGSHDSDAGRRRSVRRGLVAWLALSAVGVGIVLVPDEGPRVFSLSQGHGPSVSDLIGVLVLVAGWACLLAPLIRARDLVPSGNLFLLPVAAGLALVAWSVTQDAGSWWVLGVFVAAGSQLVAAGIVAYRTRWRWSARRGTSEHG